MSRTKDVMSIFWWNSEEGGHEEVPGLTVMGIASDVSSFYLIDTVTSKTLDECEAVEQYKWRKIDIDEQRSEIVLDVKLNIEAIESSTEPQYREMLENILGGLHGCGFQVVWVGVDYETDLEDPFYEDQTVYAAISRPTGLIIGSDWNEDVRPIDKKYLPLLRNEVKST